MADKSNFEQELKDIINRYSKENGSNTPDFILGEYLTDCLKTFERAVNWRDNWHNRSSKTTQSNDPDDIHKGKKCLLKEKLGA